MRSSTFLRSRFSTSASTRPKRCGSSIPGQSGDLRELDETGHRPQASITVLNGRGLPTPPELDPASSRWSGTPGIPDSVEAQQTLMVPGAANFVATTSGAVTAGTRRASTGSRRRGSLRHRVGAEHGAGMGINPATAVQAPWPIIRTFAAGPAVGKADALVARDTISQPAPPSFHRCGRTPEGSHVQTRFCQRPRAAAPTVTGAGHGESTAGSARARAAEPSGDDRRTGPSGGHHRDPRGHVRLGVRSLQSGFFPMIGLVGFGALMVSAGSAGARRISWGAGEATPRVPAAAARR